MSDSTAQKRAWSSKNNNHRIEQKVFQEVGTVHACIAISRERGLVDYAIQAAEWESQSFCEFVLRLKEKVPYLALFLDNAGWHKSTYTVSFCQERQIPLIFNVPSSPMLAPVEHSISLVKQRYRKLRLSFFNSSKAYYTRELLISAFKSVSSKTVANMMTKAFKRWTYDDYFVAITKGGARNY